VFRVFGFLEGPLSKWWYSQVAQTRDEVGGGFSGVSEMERALILELCGKTPAGQARLNFDKTRKKTTVLLALSALPSHTALTALHNTLESIYNTHLCCK
jgi:hypothetical protein